MALTIGDKLGPYEIVGLLGKGGMGEVYRARDPRLGREVAIKVCAERFSERFEREARTVAALNHPNIAHLYDVVISKDAPNYLVMELVEGETLKGPLRAAEVRRIAAQISAALEAAHEKGIVHRDLKPANIKITPDGTVKVLDFGLAKVGAITGPAEDLPTLPMGLTEAGMILGTAAYMCPEQARGKPVDKRADIWAFGVVLYELLSGDHLHQGETVSDTLASVLTQEPNWEKVPPNFQVLLRRCLEKDPRKRLRDIGDAMPLVDEEVATAPSSRGSVRAAWLVAAACAFAALALAAIHFREKPPAPPPLTRFQIHLPEDVKFTTSGSFTMSPDGRHVAFSAHAANQRPGVWIQDLDSLKARYLPATLTGPNPPPFFWSPDSRYVVYSENSPRLKKVDIASGSVLDISDKPSPPIGGDWNQDGTIIFGSTNGGLWKVSASGGTPAPLTALDPARHEREHELPSFLPDGKHFLYLRYSTTNPENSGIFVGSLDDPPDKQSTKRLLESQTGAYYVPAPQGGSGWLIYLRDNTLLAQSFDPNSLETSGEPMPVAEGVGFVYETGYFSAKGNVLVYRATRTLRDFQLTWFDRQGKIVGKVGEPGQIAELRVSPDGTRAAYRKVAENIADQDIWILDLVKGSTSRFTFGQRASAYPAWSPDSSELMFASDRDGNLDLFRKPANGAAEELPFLQSTIPKRPESWSKDGRFLVFSTGQGSGFAESALWVMPLQGADRRALLLQQNKFVQTEASFSPDGRWIAYTSNESGRFEIYVRQFDPVSGSPGSGKWLVSNEGGSDPAWRSDGKELVYIALNGDAMSVSVDATHAFQAGTPKKLFQIPMGSTEPAASADLKRFLIPVPSEDKQSPQIFNVILNWTPGIKPK